MRFIFCVNQKSQTSPVTCDDEGEEEAFSDQSFPPGELISTIQASEQSSTFPPQLS